MRTLLCVVALALVASGCESPSSMIAVSVTPDPIPLQRFAYGHGRYAYVAYYTVNVRAMGGVGGRVEAIRTIVREAASGRQVSEDVATAEQIAFRAGTNAMRPSGTLAVELEWTFPYEDVFSPPVLARLSFMITVQFTDDNGHAFSQMMEVAEAWPRFPGE